MNKLLKITQDCESLPEAQSHALNILRALFRHTQLGEIVTPYVSPGVEAALRAFRSNFWGVSFITLNLLFRLPLINYISYFHTCVTFNIFFKNSVYFCRVPVESFFSTL